MINAFQTDGCLTGGKMGKNKKIGRNDLCPCGSGKKYKHCCMNKEQEVKRFDPRAGFEKVWKIMNEDGIKDPAGNKVWMEHGQYNEKLGNIRGVIKEYKADALEKASDEGDPKAQFYLGFAYLDGYYAERDYSKAFNLFKSASEKGDSLAVAFVRLCLFHGIGTQVDIDAYGEYLNGNWNIDWDDELFSWEYYRRGYYAEYAATFFEFIEDAINDLDKAVPENEEQENWLKTYKANREYFIQFLDDYALRINTCVIEIDPKIITDEILTCMGYSREKIEEWRTTNQIKEQKRRIADKLSILIETARFLTELLNGLLTEIYSTLLDFELSKEEKRNYIDILWLKYDFLRLKSQAYVEHGIFDLDFFNYEAYRTLDYIDNKTGLKQNISIIFDELWGLVVPFDFRACRLFFDLYRLDERRFDKAEWAFIYAYSFIHRNFVLANAISENVFLDTFAAPTYYEVDKISINAVLRNTIDAIGNCITLYDSINNGKVDSNEYEYAFDEAPTQRELWAQDIGTT